MRYKRNASEEIVKPEKKQKTIWDSLQDQDLDPASQLVAKYNGSDDIQEVRIKYLALCMLLNVI